MKAKVPTLEELNVKKTKDEHFRENTTQAKVSGSKIQVDHNVLLVRALKTDRCLQKSVQVLLRERTLHGKHNPAIFEQG